MRSQLLGKILRKTRDLFFVAGDMKFLWFDLAKIVSFTVKSGARVTNLVELLLMGDSRG